jgi:hypothetical protein
MRPDQDTAGNLPSGVVPFQIEILKEATFMVFGMSLATYTLIHVIISLIGIGSGLIVLFGMFGGKRLDGMTALFLATTVLTSLTGFGFPFEHVTPGIILGILSLVVLAIAVTARYSFRMAGKWRAIYVVTAVIALYFNCFVLIAQSFQKVPALHALAPKGNEPPFAIAQGILLVLFLVAGTLAVKKFRLGAAGSVARAA